MDAILVNVKKENPTMAGYIEDEILDNKKSDYDPDYDKIVDERDKRLAKNKKVSQDVVKRYRDKYKDAA
jgi:hypothetical protein